MFWLSHTWNLNCSSVQLFFGNYINYDIYIFCKYYMVKFWNLLLNAPILLWALSCDCENEWPQKKVFIYLQYTHRRPRSVILSGREVPEVFANTNKNKCIVQVFGNLPSALTFLLDILLSRCHHHHLCTWEKPSCRASITTTREKQPRRRRLNKLVFQRHHKTSRLTSSHLMTLLLFLPLKCISKWNYTLFSMETRNRQIAENANEPGKLPFIFYNYLSVVNATNTWPRDMHHGHAYGIVVYCGSPLGWSSVKVQSIVTRVAFM